ncbi:MAG TPA: dihydrofolate reductase family protein [Thermomicrobiales bacterium]|nr:dihydrofolate reductase family protein [Thermomicrobiales bacterium]
MRKLVVQSFMSLDGVVQAPGAPDEDREGGFEQGGWLIPHFDDDFLQFVTDSTQRAGALLLGRKTYDTFAASWPLRDDDDPVAAVLNRIPKYVASRTLASADWNNSTIINDDVAGEVATLKQQEGGEIQVHGSGDLVQTLLKHDLIDEFQLYTVPVLVGSGKRLFGGGTVPAGLKLVSTATTGAGITFNTYQRHGDFGIGAYGPELERLSNA